MKDEEIFKRVGANITRLRKALGLTTNELGLRCDIERSSLLHIEKGRINATLKTLNKISRELGVDVRDLFV